MRKFLIPCLWLIVVVPVALAQAPQGKLIEDHWDAAFLEGGRCGYFHSQIRELPGKDGGKLYESKLEMRLILKRYMSVVNMRMDSEMTEDEQGKIKSFKVIQFLDKGQAVQEGEVKDGKLWMKLPGVNEPRQMPWNDSVIGVYRQERLPSILKAKPSDKFEYLNFEASLMQAIKMKAELLPEEEIEVLAVDPKDPAKFTQGRKKLKKLEVTPDKISLFGSALQLPKMVAWVGDDLVAVRSRMEMPGIGSIILYRTTKEIATKEDDNVAVLPDIGLNNMIELDKRIPNVHHLEEATYHFKLDKEDGLQAFQTSGRQKVKKLDDGGYELTVLGNVAVQADEPAKEFLESSYFLESNNAEVKKLAEKAVGDETDPLKKARKIERFVHENMKGSSSVGFATAGQIAKDLQGDCRQHAMLMAAMCRAAGIPSRTALGLVYVEEPKSRKPQFGFHMWTEVYVRGGWVAMDATLGQGLVGPGHLKIADHSWQDQQTLAPLLPVIRVMGKLQMKVVSAKE